MKIIKKAITFVLSASMLMSLLPVMNVSAAENTPPSAPTGLLTNELTNPMNVEAPTFGWIVNDSDYNETQTSYQIIVTDEVTNTEVWNSGKVTSSEQSYVEYGGSALEYGHPYSWKVKTWDKDDAESPYSDSAYFATGIKNDNWDASWINSGETGANHYWYARYEKTLDSTKTIANVTTYFAGVHDYELNVNGEYIGRGQSFDYASETRYQGWDITDSAKNSDKIAIGLLNRYYGGGQGRAESREALLGHINIYYTDGTSDTIVTNGDWKVSTSVPLGGSTKRNGEGDFVEEYNAQNAQEGFSNVDFDDSSWSAATVIGAHPTEEFTNVIPELSKVMRQADITAFTLTATESAIFPIFL